MKVLIATDWFLPSLNGVVISVLNLRKQLEKKGHEVIILTLSQNNQSHKQDGVWSVAAHSAGRFYPQARVSLRSGDPIIDELIDWKPDVIHTQCEMSTFRFAKKIAKATDAPIVHTYHTVYEYYVHYLHLGPRTGRAFVAAVSRKLLNSTDQVIVPTVKTKRLLEGYRVRQPMHIVPTGIDLRRFETAPEATQLERLKVAYGLKDDEIVLVTVGRLAKEKNTEELIEALFRAYGTTGDHVPEGASRITLMVVGGGPYGEVLKEKVSQCEAMYGGTYCRVIFTGEIQQEEMPLYYHLADCYVNASVSETQGLTYIEAMACGLPAVCRRDECLEGLIHNGENGYLFETQETFLEALQKVFSSPEQYDQLQTGAKRSVELYTMERFCEHVEEVYLRAIHG